DCLRSAVSQHRTGRSQREGVRVPRNAIDPALRDGRTDKGRDRGSGAGWSDMGPDGPCGLGCDTCLAGGRDRSAVVGAISSRAVFWLISRQPNRMSSNLELSALAGLPMVRAGDDLAALIIDALGQCELRDGDVLVVAQKIVSKAEGRTVDLATVTASPAAEKLGEEVGKDSRLVD